jgi:hypothetical protein
VWFSPDPTAKTLVRRAPEGSVTATGVVREVVVPSPSSPKEF